MRSRASKSQKVKKVKKGRIRWTMNSGRRPYQLLFDSNSIIYLYLTPDTWTLIYSFPNPACPERSRREPRHSYNILSHVRRLIFDIWFARCWIYIVYRISDIINRTSLSLYRGRSPTSSTPTPDTLPVLSVFEGMQTIHLSIFLISDVWYSIFDVWSVYITSHIKYRISKIVYLSPRTEGVTRHLPPWTLSMVDVALAIAGLGIRSAFAWLRRDKLQILDCELRGSYQSGKHDGKIRG